MCGGCHSLFLLRSSSRNSTGRARLLTHSPGSLCGGALAVPLLSPELFLRRGCRASSPDFALHGRAPGVIPHLFYGFHFLWPQAATHCATRRNIWPFERRLCHSRPLRPASDPCSLPRLARLIKPPDTKGSALHRSIYWVFKCDLEPSNLRSYVVFPLLPVRCSGF